MITVRKWTTKAKNLAPRYVVMENGKPYRGKSGMDYNTILYFPTRSKANDFAKKLRKFRNLEKTIDKNHKKKIGSK